MLLRQFSSNQPILYLAVPPVVAAILVPAYLSGLLVSQQTFFPADDILNMIQLQGWAFLSVIFVLIIAGALMANHVFNRFEFFPTPSFVPSLVYGVGASALCILGVSIPALLANLLVIMGLSRSLGVYRQTRVLAEYFETGFWFGLAALTFPPLVILLPVIWVMVIYTRAFQWREFILPGLGFGTPFAYWLFWQYWVTGRVDAPLFRGYYSLASREPWTTFEWSEKYFVLGLAVVVIMSLPRFVFASDRASNKSKLVRANFLIVSLGLGGSLAIERFLVYEYTPAVVLVPLVFISGQWFSNYRYSLLAPFVFYMFILSAVLMLIHRTGVIGLPG